MRKILYFERERERERIVGDRHEGIIQRVLWIETCCCEGTSVCVFRQFTTRERDWE